MHFLYALINFLLLGGIILAVFRKTIVNIFRTRRERIERELDEAEHPAELPPLPDLGELPSGEPDPVRLAELREMNDASAARLDEMYGKESAEQRREMLLKLREHLIGRIVASAREKMTESAWQAELAQRLPRRLEEACALVRLTPGDRAYMARSGKLYVTLTAAAPLPEEAVEKARRSCEALLRAEGSEASFRYDTDETLLGGFRLRLGDTVYDYSVTDRLYQLGRALRAREVTETDAESLLRSMRAAVDELDDSICVYQVGRVLSVSDGICWLDGLSDIMYGELVEFECGERGMVMDVHPDRVGCIIFGHYENIDTLSRVRRLGQMAGVPVGESLLGRVVDALGHPVDGKGRIWDPENRPIEFGAPAIPDRRSVSVPLDTGIKAIDALVPIGRGQRELIIGDRQTGKSAVAVDAILNQKGTGVLCIYVAIGQKQAAVAEIVEKLREHGAMEYTTVVIAAASDSASLQYIAPFAGAAMGEYFMYKGRDVLIVYDDLSKHAVAYRELSLLLHRPSGREAYPGDIFYLHSRLLERAARLNEAAGGGSMTALPLIETQAGDISAYIPTNVISITDGQIFLETDLFNEGQRPAINVGLSVSRVGGSAQTKLMKQVSAHLRTELAQYRELAAFTQFGSDVDAATQKVLASGERMMAALRQDRYAPLPGWKQALLIYAVSHGAADAVEPTAMGEWEKKLYRWFDEKEPEVSEMLRTGKKLDGEAESALRAALGRFAEAH